MLLDPCWSSIQLLNYFKLTLLDETKDLMSLFQGHRLSLETFLLFSSLYYRGIISLLYKMNVAYLAWYASCIVLCVACLISLGTWNFEILIMLAFGAERKTMFCFLGIFHMYALLMQGSFTGPRIFWSGSSLRPEATGYGLVISIFNSYSMWMYGEMWKYEWLCMKCAPAPW